MKQEPGVYKKSIESGKWFAVSTIFQRLLNLIGFFVLARLLMPEDYGVITVVFTMTSLLDSVLNPGFSMALLQKKEGVEEYLPVVWTLELIKAALMALIIFAGSSLIVSFFNIPSSQAGIIRWSGVLLIISALSNPAQLYFFKELDYKKVFIRDFIGQIAYTIISIGFALTISATAWALFAGYIGRYAVGNIMSYVLSPGVPRLSFAFSRLKALVGYGKWVYGVNLLELITGSIDKILVGRLLNTAQLGFYARAKDLPGTVSGPLAGLISKVGFSAYVKIQDRPDKIQEGFLKSLDIMLLASVPFSLLLLFEGGSLVTIFLGEKWLQIVVPLKIFSVVNIFFMLTGLINPIFNAIGRPRINFQMNVLQLFLLPPALYAAIHFYGLRGAAVGLGSVWLVLLGYGMYQARPVLRIGKEQFFPSVISVTLASLATFLVALPGHIWLHAHAAGSVIMLLWVSVLGGVYFGFLLFVGKQFSTGPYHTIRSVLHELGWWKHHKV